MKKNHKFYLLLGLVLTFACSPQDDLDLALESPNQQAIMDLITINEITSNSISYSVKGENLQKLAAYAGQSFDVEGIPFKVSDGLAQSIESSNGRAPELLQPIEGGSGGRILTLDFPNNGDILVLASGFEQSGGSCNESSRTCWGGTIVEVKEDQEWGPPSQLHQASIRINGANNNWLVVSSSISEYVGSSSTYEPGAYESLGFSYKARKLSCGEDYPMSRARSTWFYTSQTAQPYTIVKCDD